MIQSMILDMKQNLNKDNDKSIKHYFTRFRAVLLKKKTALNSIVMLLCLFVLSCNPIEMSGFYARAYHGEIASEDRPIGLGQAIRDSIIEDVALIVIGNVQETYTIQFGSSSTNYDGGLFFMEAVNNNIELYKTDLVENNFSFTDGAVIGISGPGLIEILLLAVYNSNRIYSWQDLQAMRLDLTKDYVLMNNIEFPDTILDYGNFVPVGSDLNPFSGSLVGASDDKQYSISGLHIESIDNYKGLFAVIEADNGDKVVASNFILNNFTVKGNAYLGSLVGSLRRGTVDNVHVNSSETSVVEFRDNETNVLSGYGGGLIGEAGTGNMGIHVRIQNSSSNQRLQISNTTEQINTFSYIGGLVGYIHSDVVIEGSFANGAVAGEDHVGGLVAYVDTATVSGYTSGTVEGEDHVGGLVGHVDDATVLGYSTATVSGINNVGGLVGLNTGTVSGFTSKSVNGKAYVGGLVGYNAYTGIVSGYSSAVVIGDSYVGGLVGSNNSSFDPDLNTDEISYGTVSGYTRGVVRVIGTSPIIGKTIGKDSGRSFTLHSLSESKIYEGETGTNIFLIPTTELDGLDGIGISFTNSITQVEFDVLDFGTELGKWTWRAGMWPAINIGEDLKPADQQ